MAIRQSENHRIGVLASQSPLELGWFVATMESYNEAVAAYQTYSAAYNAAVNS